jgi:nicotinamidase-related amidase
MTLTTLDPATALIVVDLQKGIVDRPVAHPIGEVVRHSADLATAFRRHGLPVVLVNVTGGAPGRVDGGNARQSGGTPSPDFADIVDELDAQPDDLRVTKQRWGAFHGTPLDERLRALGVTQVVLTGVATSAGVESTARFAHEYATT